MIDLGVMDDFADNEKPAILKNFARCISKIDCALDAVAKPNCFARRTVVSPTEMIPPAPRIFSMMSLR